MKTLSLTFLSALLLLAAGCSKAQAEDPAFAAKAKSVIEGEIASRKLAGLAVAVVKDGKILLAQGYGMADLSSGRAATPATVFSTASVSKPFCAIAALQLQKEGVISLDDQVAKHIEEAPAAWKGITMRHLLQHTSGIPDYTRLPGFAALYGQDTAPSEILKHLAGKPLEFASGTRFEYSNSGFWVAALALERATKMPYAQILQEKVFKPLGMRDAVLDKPKLTLAVRATAHAETGNSPADYASPNWSFSAGAVLASAQDMAAFAQAIDKAVLPPDIFTAMSTPSNAPSSMPFKYGLGWILLEKGGRKLGGHTGNRPGASATLMRDMEARITVVVLSNRTNGDSSEVAEALLKLAREP